MSHPKEIFNTIHGGFTAGEMQIVLVHRGTGKSHGHYTGTRAPYWRLPEAPYQVLGGVTQCDDGPWYQVYCRPDVAAWVRTQDSDSWIDTGSHASLGNFFDIRDSVMTMLTLKYSGVSNAA